MSNMLFVVTVKFRIFVAVFKLAIFGVHIGAFFLFAGFFKHYLRQRCTEEEAVTRHRSLGKIVAMKIADVMKGQGSK